MKFTDQKVADKYSTQFMHDPIVHVPGGTAGDGWKGKLSTIPLQAAEKLVALESNLLEIKEGPNDGKAAKSKDS